MEEKKYTLSTVQNTFKILKEYTKGEAEIGITELSKRTELNKSTVNRIVQTLYEEDVLYKNPQTHKYGPGLTLFEIGSVVYNEFEIGQIAIPILERVKNQFKGDIHVVTYNKGDVVYLQRIPERIKALMTMKGRVSSHATAAGKLLLAYQDEEEIERVLQQDLEAYTARTITSKQELRSELIRIRARGYSFSIGERVEGVSSVSLPIFNDSKKVVAAVSLLRKNTNPTKAQILEIVNQLRMCSKLITENLGATPYNY